MKIFREIFKKVKPIYIILGLFVVVIIISALGSRKEGMTSGNRTQLRQYQTVLNDTLNQIDDFVKSRQGSGWDSNNTFKQNTSNFIQKYSKFSVDKFLKAHDTNHDGIVIVSKSDGKFIRDNDISGNVLGRDEKLFYYDLTTQDINQDGSIIAFRDDDKGNFYRDNSGNEIFNTNSHFITETIDKPISQSDIDTSKNLLTTQINQLSNSDDKTTINLLISDLIKYTDAITGLTVTHSSFSSLFQYDYDDDLNNVREDNNYTSSYREQRRYYNKNNSDDNRYDYDYDDHDHDDDFVVTKSAVHSTCDGDYTLASAASIDCINSLWKKNGCAPNLIKTSNPNFLLDSKTNQLYNITNETLGLMKKKMIKASDNPALCYGKVSPSAKSSTSVNGGSADYWKNLYLSAVSVPANGHNKASTTTHAQSNKIPSYDSTFIPSSASLAGDGKGDLTSGTGIGSGSESKDNGGMGATGTGTGTGSGTGTGTGGVVGAAPLTQDSYLLSGQSPSNCPVGGCGTGASSCNNLKPSPVPPCPPCERCPEPAFDCKKVPSYGKASNNQYLPRPVLADFSQFGM